MAAHENLLASVPTDQLVLTLLQELAARVQRLETKSSGEGQEILGHSVEKVFIEDARNDNLSLASQDDAEINANEEPSCIPYGYMLDGESASTATRIPRERINDISARNPVIGELLRQLGGIVQVPADFRFELTNFWTLDDIVQKGLLHGAIEFLDELGRSGGNYWITDYDLKSNIVHYEYGFTPKCSLEIPVTSRNHWDHLEKSTSWRRVILMQGFSEMSSQLRYGYLRRYGELILTYRNPFFSAVSPTDAINMHLGKSFGQAMLLGGGYRFHLSWCRARRIQDNRVKSRQGAEELKIGQLYGSTEQFLCQEAYTIHAIPGSRKHDSIISELAEDGCADFQQYWTILLLAPLGFYRRGLLKVPRVVSELEASPLQINMVVLIEDALGAARRAWRGLHQYVEELLGTGTEIFDPELHDSLLSDDELFSGSRKYFWLINSLQTFDNIMRQNAEAWTSYRDKFLLPLSGALLDRTDVTWKKELDESIELCDRLVEDLERVRRLFRDQRERTLALREGLFSASAVIESRASTRLGENVKLLTYVSIFYLPLAFCTSLWSTSDIFGFDRLVYVTVIVAVTTYILVFNLNNLVKSAQTSYLRFKGNLVEEMMRERHIAWMETGLQFNRYKPRNTPKEAHPSEWWIFVYKARKTMQFLRLWRKYELNESESISDKLDDVKSGQRRSGVGDNTEGSRKRSWKFFRGSESRKATEA